MDIAAVGINGLGVDEQIAVDPSICLKGCENKKSGASALQQIPIYMESLPQNNLHQCCEEKEQKAMKTTWN